MKVTLDDNGNAKVEVSESDVESAVCQFICTCHPEFATGFTINPAVIQDLNQEFIVYEISKGKK